MPVSEIVQRLEVPSPRTYAPEMTAAMMRTLQTVDSSPIESPTGSWWPGPSGWTRRSPAGLNLASVKYWVEDLDDAREDQAEQHGHRRTEVVHVDRADHEHGAAEIAAEMKKPRLIARMPCSVSLRGVTARIPMIDVITPTARTNNGNITPRSLDLGAGERCGPEDQRRDEGHLVRLEQVGRHPRTVAHVVAHVVGDHGRVPRVVLGDPHLDLADEVGPTSAALVKMPPPTRMNIARSPAEANPTSTAVILLVDQQDHGGPRQPEPDGEHPATRRRGTRSAAPSQAGLLGGVRGAHVRADGQPHTYPVMALNAAPRRKASERPNRSANSLWAASSGTGSAQEQQDRDDRHEYGHGAELAEVRLRADLDRGGDLAHLRRSLGAARTSRTR